MRLWFWMIEQWGVEAVAQIRFAGDGDIESGLGDKSTVQPPRLAL